MERLVAALTADLTPVRRLSAPFLRAQVWLAITVAIAVALAVFSDLGAMGRRLGASPDLWVAAAGSAMTAVVAAIAAFELNLPDRKPLWALLPLPAAILWVVASGIGCLRSWFVADTGPAPLAETRDCLTFIVGLSVPLAAVLIVMLRRGYSLHPNLTLLVRRACLCGRGRDVAELLPSLSRDRDRSHRPRVRGGHRDPGDKTIWRPGAGRQKSASTPVTIASAQPNHMRATAVARVATP